MDRRYPSVVYDQLWGKYREPWVEVPDFQRISFVDTETGSLKSPTCSYGPDTPFVWSVRPPKNGHPRPELVVVYPSTYLWDYYDHVPGTPKGLKRSPLDHWTNYFARNTRSGGRNKGRGEGMITRDPGRRFIWRTWTYDKSSRQIALWVWFCRFGIRITLLILSDTEVLQVLDLLLFSFCLVTNIFTLLTLPFPYVFLITLYLLLVSSECLPHPPTSLSRTFFSVLHN